MIPFTTKDCDNDSLCIEDNRTLIVAHVLGSPDEHAGCYLELTDVIRLQKWLTAWLNEKFPELPMKLFERIQFPESKNGCWIWKGYRHKSCPTICLDRSNKNVQVKRLIYSRFNGLIPDGAKVTNSCDNKYCVNPAHLKLILKESDDVFVPEV